MASKRDAMKARMGAGLTRETQTPRPATAKKPPRTDLVRITVDLEPTLHRDVKRWAFEEDAKLADVARSAFRAMLDDPEVAERIRNFLNEGRQ